MVTSCGSEKSGFFDKQFAQLDFPEKPDFLYSTEASPIRPTAGPPLLEHASDSIRSPDFPKKPIHGIVNIFFNLTFAPGSFMLLVHSSENRVRNRSPPAFQFGERIESPVSHRYWIQLSI
jgi:hypothetical protein